jgi:GLPGLI family protein
MKRIFLVMAGLVSLATTNAQTTAGKMIFERTVEVNFQIQGADPAMQQMVPKTKTDRYELLFGENKSLWRMAPKEDDGGDMGGSNGMQVQVILAGSEDVSYYNFTEARKVDMRELGTKRFIIADSIRKMNWKLTGETKTISGYSCMKATTEKVVKKVAMIMENNEPRRQEISDTQQIAAWFTNEIPVSAGPETYQGQLPGAILEIDINNGKTTYILKEISTKVDLAEIKEPKNGKSVTPDEFKAEREKIMKDMQKNQGTFRMRSPN